ncbi:MAG TPA: hypothetical protein VM008_07255 [Phycisphaerae bacterium]|nr:hypothetical protein [Phycisphaerae bacterium]
MMRNLFIIGTIAEIALVSGQLLLKRAMHAGRRATMANRTAYFAVSIVAQAIYFFLWLGLLHDYPLSSVYPFDAGAIILLVVAGILLLNERMTVRGSIAIVFILMGLAIISFS